MNERERREDAMQELTWQTEAEENHRRAEAAEFEVERLRAEVERLREDCRSYLWAGSQLAGERDHLQVEVERGRQSRDALHAELRLAQSRVEAAEAEIERLRGLLRNVGVHRAEKVSEVERFGTFGGVELYTDKPSGEVES